MRRRSRLKVMAGLAGLIRPLAGFMAGAVAMGLCGHLCASFITVLGGYAALNAAGYGGISFGGLSLTGIFIIVCIMAILRGVLRYGEQTCNHYIAFKLLAIIRDKVFKALRKLCPAKLEGRDRGDLISVITSDIEICREIFVRYENVELISNNEKSISLEKILSGLQEKKTEKLYCAKDTLACEIDLIFNC